MGCIHSHKLGERPPDYHPKFVQSFSDIVYVVCLQYQSTSKLSHVSSVLIMGKAFHSIKCQLESLFGISMLKYRKQIVYVTIYIKQIKYRWFVIERYFLSKRKIVNII